VAGLALPSDIVVVGMQFSHPPGSPLWLIHLTVSVPSERQLELLTKRLNRLVDVRRVVRLEAEPFVSPHRERQGRRTANA
jgi:acetolactate synthase-1/3 small subunit